MELPPALSRREYQFDALEAVAKDWESGSKESTVVMATGLGKTIFAGLLIKYATEVLDKKALFIAHRSELIDQAENCFSHAFGFTTAIERGQESEKEYRRLTGITPDVVVASLQSLHQERMMGRFRRDRFGLIIIDECHHAPAQSYLDVIDHFNYEYLLGITATPETERKSGSTGAVFKKVSYQKTLTQAVREGHLCPVVLKTIPVPVNLKDIRTTGGDFNSGDLAERISPAMETLCTQIRANIGERQTVVFLPDVGSAQACANMLNLMKPGLANYVAGEGGKFGISKELRKERLAAFRKHEFQVICCCDLLIEGWDMRSVSCVVIARPTKKFYRAVQMVGRGTRLSPETGKVNCLVLDLDWQTDRSSRKLCHLYTLYDDGSIEKGVMAKIAKDWEKGGKSAGGVDLMEKIKEAEKNVRFTPTIQVTYSGQHGQLYEAMASDPLGVGKVLDLGLKKRTDFDIRGGGPITPYQIDKLRTLGVRNPEKMSMWGASKMIGKLESREKKGLASHQQVKMVLGYGVNEDQARGMTKQEAAAIIAKHVLQSQGSLF